MKTHSTPYGTRRHAREEGERLKAEGIARVAGVNKRWLSAMRDEARRLCALQGDVTADDLRDFADNVCVYAPTHRNAWGAIFREAGWRAQGPCDTKSTKQENHARLLYRWRWTGQS